MEWTWVKDVDGEGVRAWVMGRAQAVGEEGSRRGR